MAGLLGFDLSFQVGLWHGVFAICILFNDSVAPLAFCICWPRGYLYIR